MYICMYILYMYVYMCVFDILAFFCLLCQVSIFEKFSIYVLM